MQFVNLTSYYDGADGSSLQIESAERASEYEPNAISVDSHLITYTPGHLSRSRKSRDLVASMERKRADRTIRKGRNKASNSWEECDARYTNGK